MLLCIRSDRGIERLTVASYREASEKVRGLIERYDLTAGCSNTGNAFHLATIASVGPHGRPLATVSYNGRVWACKDGKEIGV